MSKETLRLKRGDTWGKTLTFKNNDVAVDITGSTVVLTIKSNYDDAEDSVIQKVVTSHSDPTNGVTEVTVDAADWVGILSGDYVYDIEIIFSDGSTYTPQDGACVVSNDVSRYIVP